MDCTVAVATTPPPPSVMPPMEYARLPLASSAMPVCQTAISGPGTHG